MLDVARGNELDILGAAASGMLAQRTALDLAARNVAAAQASSPGHPYARLVAQFGDAAQAPDIAEADGPADEDDGLPPVGALADGDLGDAASSGPALVGIRSERGSGDALTEMIAVLDAQRAYEQHASIFDIGKRLAERTIDVGRS